LFGYNKDLSKDELIEIMEDRVELKGREWLRKCQLDEALFNEIIAHYNPEDTNLLVP